MSAPLAAVPAKGPLDGTPYRALSRLGRGAMSDVIEALDPDGRTVALKLLAPSHRAMGTAAARLRAEGRILSELRHPHLVRVLGDGTTADGRPYLVMTRLRGETLRARLAREGALPAPEAARIAADALTGLEHAHRAGIVHRDVKPSNLFLCAEPPHALPGPALAGRTRGAPHVVVVDFGIAKVLAPERAAAITADDAVLGTPRYLSPEQVLGGEVDARTDVYSMGAVLFQMIAGRPPFDGDDVIDLLRAHLDREPPSLHEVCARRVPRRLAAAVARALRKPPGERFPSARAFADEIRAAVVGAAAARAQLQNPSGQAQ